MADTEISFTVSGPDADEREVTDALDDLRGVQMVDVDEGSGEVTVRYGEELHSEEEIRSAVAEAGYEVE